MTKVLEKIGEDYCIVHIVFKRKRALLEYVLRGDDLLKISVERTMLGKRSGLKPDKGKAKGRHITLVERLKSHTTTSEALVMSQAKLA